MFDQRRQLRFAGLRGVACRLPGSLAATLGDRLAADEQPIARIQALTGIAGDAFGGIRNEHVAGRRGPGR